MPKSRPAFVRTPEAATVRLLLLLLVIGIQLVRSEVPNQLSLHPVFLHQRGDRKYQFTSESNTPQLLRGNGTARQVFHAVEATEWPGGLVPIFGFIRQGVYQLSRTQKPGWENLMEPIFFALPRATETNAMALCGKWSVTAIHADGHSDQFSWELTTDGAHVAGRMDQATDYRFATVSGGEWDGVHLELKIDYINDHFEMSDRLDAGTLSGGWRRTDDGDHGAWTAKRSAPLPMINVNDFKVAPLCEWTNISTAVKRYTINPIGPGEAWQRSERPVCRVWTSSPPANPGGPEVP